MIGSHQGSGAVFASDTPSGTIADEPVLVAR